MDKSFLRQQLREIADMIYDLVQHEYLYLDTAITVKLTPHSIPDNFWAVCVSSAYDVFLMDSQEQWFQVEACDRGAENVISSLYQRMKILSTKYDKK